ncbi:MAG: PIN domain-containing protein [Thermodesulfobacteriota bacterium]
MTTVFVDANVFLRFFTVDHAGQHEKAAALFEAAAAGRIRLVTGPPVLFEIAWTLRSAYHLSQEQTLDALEAMLAFKGLKLSDADLVEEAVRLARSSDQEFADAYIGASAQAWGAEIATFNKKHFRKMGAGLHQF